MKKIDKQFAVIEWTGKNLDMIKATLSEATFAQEKQVNGALIISYRGKNNSLYRGDTIWLDEKGDLYVNLFLIE